MINLNDFLNTAESVLEQEHIQQALDLMHETPYQSRKRVGLFAERFEYSADFDPIIAFTAAYLKISADEVLGYIRYIDRQSPLEMIFVLAFILYADSYLDALYIDGHKVPSRRAPAEKEHGRVVSIHSQFPLRFGTFRRDVDFIVEVNADELAVEIDGASFHSSHYALQRDLSTEVIFQAAHIPVARLSSAMVRFSCFELIASLCNKQFNPPQYQDFADSPQPKEYFHSIEVYPQPPCLVTLIARILDYYFSSLVISSIRFQKQEDDDDEAELEDGGPMSVYRLPLKPGHYVSFNLHYDAMQAHISIDSQGIHVTSNLLSTQHTLLLALLWGINGIKKDSVTCYRAQLIDQDNPNSSSAALLASKVGHVTNRISLLSCFTNQRDPGMYDESWKPEFRYNQQALDCPDIDITPATDPSIRSVLAGLDIMLGEYLRCRDENFLLHQHLRSRLPRHYLEPSHTYAGVVMAVAAKCENKKQSYLEVCRQSPKTSLGGYLAYLHDHEEDVETLFPLDQRRQAVMIEEKAFKDLCEAHRLPWGSQKSRRLVDCVFRVLPHSKDYPTLWDYSDEARVVWVHVSQLGLVDID